MLSCSASTRKRILGNSCSPQGFLCIDAERGKLLLAAPHEDEVTTLAGMDVLEAGAEPAVESGDEGSASERCVLHDVGSFPCAALPGRFFLTVKRLWGEGLIAEHQCVPACYQIAPQRPKESGIAHAEQEERYCLLALSIG